MTERKLTAQLSREQILERVVTAEREAQQLLAEAARLTSDPEERRLYRKLAGREADTLRELIAEEDRLEAEAFVQKAIDV